MKSYKLFFTLLILLITVGCTQAEKETSIPVNNQAELNQPVELEQQDYFNIGELITLSEDSYFFQISYQRQIPFKDEPQITYKPFFEYDYEEDFKSGELLNEDTVHFESLYSASEKDPYAAWYIGSENYHYLDFAVVTNNEMKNTEELFFIFVSGAHEWVTKVVDEQDVEITPFHDDSDIDIYHFNTDKWYTIYFKNINQDIWHIKVKLTW